MLALEFVEGIMLIRIKTELSRFKALKGVRSGSLKLFIWGKPLKVLHAVPECRTIYTAI